MPVMPAEVIRYMAPKPGGVYVDGTIGGGGHAKLILEETNPDGLLIGFDRDAEALRAAQEKLIPFGERVRLVHGNFTGLGEVLAGFGIDRIDGFILDLGVSSHQLDSAERGFSFRKDTPLDMRMDRDSDTTAADLVNTLPEQELARIIRVFGEERWACRIAAFIAAAREEAPIETTLRLVNIIKGAIPRGAWEERLHPATRTFQALRIAVNDELASLEKGLDMGIRMLKRGGRGVVIAFHSLEDRIVKNSFRRFAHGCSCPKGLPYCVCGNMQLLRVLTGKPVMAGGAEVEANPRARSAKLRAAERL
jgi:16S rRNA (cytosine1402-N4)-methyltransferase